MRVTCPSRHTLKGEDLPSHGPSLDHHGVASTATWVASLIVWLGSTPILTTLMSCISASEVKV
jgi:hypothetical protein